MSDLKIAVNIFYKPIDQLKDFLVHNRDLYIPINGGSELKNDAWCRQNVFFDDSIPDNISSHNRLLNENTSIYWFWKNLEQVGQPDYVGFNHYRRFFSRLDLADYQKYDVIVAQPIKCLYSLEWQYQYYHNAGDLKTCIDYLKEVDQKFGYGFETYLRQHADNFAPMNMFVMCKDLFNEWCSFIFPILLQLEQMIDVTGRDNYQKRAVCFLEERIFGYWCWTKKLIGHRVKQVKVEEHLDWKDNKLNERGTYG